MKTNKKMLILSSLTMMLTIPHALPVLANENPLAITSETDQEILTPDLSLPSLTKLSQMRMSDFFNLKEVTETYSNWLSDKPSSNKTLRVKCTELINSEYVTVKVLDRYTSNIMKKRRLRVGQSFNLKVPAGTQWDLYVKADTYGRASLTIKD